MSGPIQMLFSHLSTFSRRILMQIYIFFFNTNAYCGQGSRKLNELHVFYKTKKRNFHFSLLTSRNINQNRDGVNQFRDRISTM